MLAFDTAQFDGILKKLSEFNNSLLSDPVSYMLQNLIIASSFYMMPALELFYFRCVLLRQLTFLLSAVIYSCHCTLINSCLARLFLSDIDICFLVGK